MCTAVFCSTLSQHADQTPPAGAGPALDPGRCTAARRECRRGNRAAAASPGAGRELEAGPLARDGVRFRRSHPAAGRRAVQRQPQLRRAHRQLRDAGGNFTFRRERDGSDDQSPITRAKIQLPKTQRRLQLLIERDIEGTTASDSQRQAEVAAGQATVDNNPYVALRALNAQHLKLKLSADGGVRMRSPPDPFVRVRAARSFSAGDWQIPVSETLLARRSEPFSATTQIGFLRGITADTAVAFTSNATWRENLRGFDLSQTANAVWLIHERALVALELGAYGTTQPAFQDTAYSAALRYRRKVYRDWLLVELRPQVVYPRSNDFRPQPSITLQLEVYFGKNYLPGLK